MANYCSNVLILTGDKKSLDKFCVFARGYFPEFACKDEHIFGGTRVFKEQSLFQFNKFVPIPVAILKQGWQDAGYDFVVAHWGTRSSAQTVRVDRQLPTRLCYEFDTPWSPSSEELIEAISKKFKSLQLRLEYDEPGCSFRGFIEACAGEITDSHHEEYENECEEDAQ